MIRWIAIGLIVTFSFFVINDWLDEREYEQAINRMLEEEREFVKYPYLDLELTLKPYDYEINPDHAVDYIKSSIQEGKYVRITAPVTKVDIIEDVYTDYPGPLYGVDFSADNLYTIRAYFKYELNIRKGDIITFSGKNLRVDGRSLTVSDECRIEETTELERQEVIEWPKLVVQKAEEEKKRKEIEQQKIAEERERLAKLEKERFSKVTSGMSYDQVSELFQDAGQEVRMEVIDNEKLNVFQWELSRNYGYTVYIMFKNDKVIAKEWASGESDIWESETDFDDIDISTQNTNVQSNTSIIKNPNRTTNSSSFKSSTSSKSSNSSKSSKSSTGSKSSTSSSGSSSSSSSKSSSSSSSSSSSKSSSSRR
ncbi:hypothetical protein [Brevibacillus sp. SYSU BS000544]|uniref:hypothetical protein n=1 Tax=Brevibacillus sp. SYSU BS000544 TaxID=3416443 RepID=UPI003CE49809